jgi:hypothetical protein
MHQSRPDHRQYRQHHRRQLPAAGTTPTATGAECARSSRWGARAQRSSWASVSARGVGPESTASCSISARRTSAVPVDSASITRRHQTGGGTRTTSHLRGGASLCRATMGDGTCTQHPLGTTPAWDRGSVTAGLFTLSQTVLKAHTPWWTLRWGRTFPCRVYFGFGWQGKGGSPL